MSGEEPRSKLLLPASGQDKPQEESIPNNRADLP